MCRLDLPEIKSNNNKIKNNKIIIIIMLYNNKNHQKKLKYYHDIMYKYLQFKHCKSIKIINIDVQNHIIVH